MSKPFFRIDSATYSSSNLTLNYTFWRNRGSIFGGSDLTVTGISSTSSLTFNEPLTYDLDGASKSITVVNLEGADRTTYTDPSSITWTFGGQSATASSNVKLTIDDPKLGNGQQLSSVTASSLSLSTFLSAIASSISGNSSGVSATSTATTLVVSVPNTGNKFNGKQVYLNLDAGTGTIIGTSSAGVTNSATFSGGVTNFSIGLSSLSGGFTDTYEISSNTYSLIP
jgi:hypothetical protein